MDVRLENYLVKDAHRIGTPALLIYPELVDHNIQVTLGMVGNDPQRWRPHIKTAKLSATLKRFLAHGISNFKCATTLELLRACEAGATDVLVAFAVTGANAARVAEIAAESPQTRVSVLIEAATQLTAWRDTKVGIYVDINPGMNRTGVAPDHTDEIVSLCRAAGKAFGGLHWYDGQISKGEPAEREASAHQGYDRLMNVIRAVQSAGIPVAEVITSGTPVAPYGYSYTGFKDAGFVHRISPGTVVYHDFTTLAQLATFGYKPAALILASVISHPLPQQITCDGGHKSVSADAGVPTCVVVGHPELVGLKPSEEHLPIEGPDPSKMPQIGEQLYLLPRHICPSVNNFDEALMITNGEVTSIEPVSARGHETRVPMLA